MEKIVRFRRESTFGGTPVGQMIARGHEPRALHPHPDLPVAHAVFTCNCGGRADTERALATTDVAIGGFSRHVGVPCDQCDRTYTVEVVPE